LETFNY